MNTTTTKKQNWLLRYLIGSIVLLIVFFLVALALFTTVWEPYMWSLTDRMPEELSGGGPPKPGDCTNFFNGNLAKLPPFGKPVDCRMERGYEIAVYYVQLDNGLILMHDILETRQQQAFDLVLTLTLWLACLLFIPFLFFALIAARKSAAQKTRSIP